MKKALFAIAMAALGSSAYAAVDGSLHDMGGKGGTRSACVYCHAAHKGVGGTVPLWNRTMSAQTFVQTSMRDNGVQRTVSGAKSLTCLSCHDGTVNLGTTLSNPETLAAIGAAFVVGGAAGGANLDSDHPVSLAYPAAATGSLVARATAAGNLSLVGGAASLTTIECGSCHNPHETTNAKFLRIAADQICTACHSY